MENLPDELQMKRRKKARRFVIIPISISLVLMIISPEMPPLFVASLDRCYILRCESKHGSWYRLLFQLGEKFTIRNWRRQ